MAALTPGNDKTLPSYVLPSPLKISTYTMICNINHRVELDILSRCISIYDKTDPVTETINGTFTSISTYSSSSTTDYARGIISPKIPKRVFNNEITLIYKYWGFKQINLKIFSNGKLQMTGIIDPDFETNHIGSYLINVLKSLKYKIYFKPNLDNIKTHDFIVYWNDKTNQLDYMRRNIEYQCLDYILQNGIGYNFKNNNWLTSEQVKQILSTYIEKANCELVPLEQLRMELFNTYEYPEQLRLQLISKLEKFKKIRKIEKKHMKLENKRFMDIITEAVADFIIYLRTYKTRIQQLIDTDTQFVSHIGIKYGIQLSETVKQGVETYVELDSTISTCTDYKISNIAIELINSDYNTRFNNNLIKLNELLNSSEYNIYNSYKPDERYAGIIAKYMYNNAYSDSTKYMEGKCYCEKSCITSGKKSCISVSISIFRPGSIIITAGKDVNQLIRVYNYLNGIFKKHFDTISYIDVHDNQDHFLLNEERKIMRKDNLVYIKKSNIRSPGAVDTGLTHNTINSTHNNTCETIAIADSEKMATATPDTPTNTSTIVNLIKRGRKKKTITNEQKNTSGDGTKTFNITDTPLLDLSTLNFNVKFVVKDKSKHTKSESK